jgi:hypothetical protein
MNNIYIRHIDDLCQCRLVQQINPLSYLSIPRHQLDTCMVTDLTATKFKPLILPTACTFGFG